MGAADPQVDAAAELADRIELGRAQREQADPAYRQTLLAVAADARARGDVDLLVEAVLENRRATVSIVGQTDHEKRALCQAALDAVGHERTPRHALLLAQLAAEATFANDHTRRIALVDEAEALARAIGDQRLLAEVLVRTGFPAVRLDRVDRVLARAAEGVELADATGDPSLRVEARIWRAAALAVVGDVVHARRVRAHARVIADQECSPTLCWMIRMMGIQDAASSGELDAAGPENEACLELGQEIGQPDTLMWWGSVHCYLALLESRLADIAELAALGAGQYTNLPIWRAFHVLVLARTGRQDEARAVLEAHPIDERTLTGDQFPLVGHYQLGMIAWLLDMPELAERTAAVVEAHPELWSQFVLGIHGPLRHPLGLCRIATGRMKEGFAELERAIADALAAGCPPIADIIRVDLGSALLRDGHPRRARAVLTQAAESAAATGAKGTAAAARELLGAS